MNRATPHSPFFRRLAVQLTLAVIVPVVVIVTLSFFMLMNAITDEIAKSAGGQLRAASSLQSMIDLDLQNTFTKIAIDGRLERVAQIPTFAQITRSTDIQYDLMEFVRQLNDIVRTQPILHSIHLVLDDVDWVASSVDGVIPRSQFSDHAWLDSVLALDDEARQEVMTRPHIPVAFTAFGETSQPSPSANQTLPRFFRLTPYLSTLSGWIVMEVNERELSRVINNADPGLLTSVSILNQHGRYLSTTDRTLVGKNAVDAKVLESLASNDEPQGFVISSRGGTDHLMTWFRRDGDSQVFVGDTSLEDLNRKLSGIRVLTFGVSIAIVVAGLLGISWFSFRFFSPVRRLVNRLRSDSELEGATKGDELESLSDAFEALIRSESQLFTRLEGAGRQRTDEWILKVFTGVLEEPERNLPPPLKDCVLSAGMILLDGVPAFHSRYLPEERPFLLNLVVHMAEQATGPQWVCQGVAFSDHAIALVLGRRRSLGAEGFDDDLESAFLHMGQQASGLVGTTVTICHGSEVSSADHLHESWTTCLRLSRRRFLEGRGRFFSDHDSPVSGSRKYPRMEIRAVLNALETGDRPGLEPAVRELGEAVRSQAGLTYDHAMLIYNQVVSGLLRFLLDHSIDLDEVFGAQRDLYHELQANETLDDVQGWISDRLVQAIDAVEAAKSEPRHHAASIVSYLHTNFRHDFGIEEVASHVGLSYSHVRRVFLEELGDSIVGYVNRLRIEEAKRLLTETSETLEAVARKVGYNNSQSFSRYFKKFTAVTPGDFRSSSITFAHK